MGDRAIDSVDPEIGVTDLDDLGGRAVGLREDPQGPEDRADRGDLAERAGGRQRRSLDQERDPARLRLADLGRGGEHRQGQPEKLAREVGGVDDLAAVDLAEPAGRDVQLSPFERQSRPLDPTRIAQTLSALSADGLQVVGLELFDGNRPGAGPVVDDLERPGIADEPAIRRASRRGSPRRARSTRVAGSKSIGRGSRKVACRSARASSAAGALPQGDR